MPRMKSTPLPSVPANPCQSLLQGTIRFSSTTSYKKRSNDSHLYKFGRLHPYDVDYKIRSENQHVHKQRQYSSIKGYIEEAISVYGDPCPTDFICDFVSTYWKPTQYSSGDDLDQELSEEDVRDLISHYLENSPKEFILVGRSRNHQERWILNPKFEKGGGDVYSDDHDLSDESTEDCGGGRISVLRSYNTAAADGGFSVDLHNSLRVKRRRSLLMNRPVSSEGVRSGASGDGAKHLKSLSHPDADLNIPDAKRKISRYMPLNVLEAQSIEVSKISPGDFLERVKESKLTSLQIVISVAIIRSGIQDAKLDYILDFVCENYPYLLDRDGNVKAIDPKRAVLASLSKNASSSPLFFKSGDNTWRIAPKNVFYGMKEFPSDLLEYMAICKSAGDSLELTELQKMIMKAISLEGGCCSLEKIYDHVKPQYDRLKRRNGSSYASNARRAIQASLSNNSSNRPIFKLVYTPGKDEPQWALTDRGAEAFEMINSLKDLSGEAKLFKAASNLNQTETASFLSKATDNINADAENHCVDHTSSSPVEPSSPLDALPPEATDPSPISEQQPPDTVQDDCFKDRQLDATSSSGCSVDVKEEPF